MAEVAGKSGSITFANFQTSAKNWTLNWTGDLEEITDFADGSDGVWTRDVKYEMEIETQ